MQSVSQVHHCAIPSNTGSGRANAGDCCPICLATYDAQLPTVTTECGHQAHSRCLAQWKIAHPQSICPVCTTTQTGTMVDDVSSPVPAVGGNRQQHSSDALKKGLLQAAKASCNTDQADALLALYSPLDDDAQVLCAEIVSKLLCKAMIRVSVMSWCEYDQLRNFISVFVKHGAVTPSWEEEDVPHLFNVWKAYERDDISQATANSGVIIRSSSMQKALRKAALSKDFDRTVRLLDYVGSDERLQKVAIEVVESLLQERLASGDRFDLEEYDSFKAYLDLFLCRGFCGRGIETRAMQLYILMSDYRRAALAKEEFGMGVIDADTLRLHLDRAALDMDFEETRSLLEIALPDAGVQEIASNVLHNVLLRSRSRFQLLSSMDLIKLGWLVDVFFQLGILGQAEADNTLDIFILCEDYPGAVRLKKLYGAEPKTTTWEVAMHKAASSKDYLLAGMLLNLTNSQVLRDMASTILSGQLQTILSQVRDFDMGPRELKKLWQLVHSFFSAGVVDAKLVGLTATVYEQVNDWVRVACLRSMYAKYFNGSAATTETGLNAANGCTAPAPGNQTVLSEA